MTIPQIQQLFLRCRGTDGLLDIDNLISEDKATTQLNKPRPMDGLQQLQYVRRMQGLPDYLIDKELETMKAKGKARKSTNGRK